MIYSIQIHILDEAMRKTAGAPGMPTRAPAGHGVSGFRGNRALATPGFHDPPAAARDTRQMPQNARSRTRLVPCHRHSTDPEANKLNDIGL
jgi:hypothetical protein